MIFNGAFYELICYIVFIFVLMFSYFIWNRNRKRAETLISILVMGFFFSLAWEPQGTGLVWVYRGFKIIAFMDIPFSLFLSWSLWMALCYIIAHRIIKELRKVSKRYQLISKIAFFISGIIVASLIEPLSVSLGWWDYLVIGEKAVLSFPLLGVNFNLTVIVGWGMLTTINLTLSTEVAKRTSIRIIDRLKLHKFYALVLSNATLGLFSGWLSWQLVGFFAAFIENEQPRFFFTRNYIVIISWLQLQIVFILITTLYCLNHVMRRSHLEE
jgi:hypothetical protein